MPGVGKSVALTAGVAILLGGNGALAEPSAAASVRASMTVAPAALRHASVPVELSVSGVTRHQVRWALSGATAHHCTATVWNAQRTAASTVCWASFRDVGSHSLVGSVRVLDRRGATVVVTSAGTRSVSAVEQTDPARLSADELQAIRRCHNKTRHVQLTFDDYGSPAQIRSIVATLDKHRVRGRFFFTGQWARDNARLMNYITSHGHRAMNHTLSHADLAKSSRARVLHEIRNGVHGKDKLLRPPYGAGGATKRLRDLAAQQGYKLCLWTLDTRDWAGPSATQMITRVRNGDATTPRVEAGGVVLMHPHARSTAAALPGIISAIRARGLVVEPKA